MSNIIEIKLCIVLEQIKYLVHKIKQSLNTNVQKKIVLQNTEKLSLFKK